MVFWGSYTNLHKIGLRQPRDLKLSGMIAYVQFYKIWDFQIPTTWNDVMMTSPLCFSWFLYKTCQRQPAAFKLCRLIIHLTFYKICKFESHVTRNDFIMMSLLKTMENNGKMRTSGEPNKIYIVGKVLMRAIQKCNFYWIWATVSKVMCIHVKFTKTTH